MFWTDEKINILKDYHSKGYSFSQVAAKVGCTRNAAIDKAKRLGLLVAGDPKITKKAAATRQARANGNKTSVPSVPKKPRGKPPSKGLRDQKPEASRTEITIKRRKRVRLPLELQADKAFAQRVLELQPVRGIEDIPNIFQCKWIDGEVKINGKWCRAPVVEGTCWCRKHIKRVYVEGTAYRKGRAPKKAFRR